MGSIFKLIALPTTLVKCILQECLIKVTSSIRCNVSGVVDFRVLPTLNYLDLLSNPKLLSIRQFDFLDACEGIALHQGQFGCSKTLEESMQSIVLLDYLYYLMKFACSVSSQGGYHHSMGPDVVLSSYYGVSICSDLPRKPFKLKNLNPVFQESINTCILNSFKSGDKVQGLLSLYSSTQDDGHTLAFYREKNRGSTRWVFYDIEPQSNSYPNSFGTTNKIVRSQYAGMNQIFWEIDGKKLSHFLNDFCKSLNTRLSLTLNTLLVRRIVSNSNQLGSYSPMELKLLKTLTL